METQFTPNKIISSLKIFLCVLILSFISQSVYAEYYLAYSFPEGCHTCHHHRYRHHIKKHKCHKHYAHRHRRSSYCVSVYHRCPPDYSCSTCESCNSCQPCGFSDAFDRCGAAPCDVPCSKRAWHRHCVNCGDPYRYWRKMGYRPGHDFVVFSDRHTSWRGTTSQCDDKDIYYNPDMSTADDYPTIYPDMNIDR